MPSTKQPAYAVPKLTDFSAPALDQAAKNLLAALESESAGITNEADQKAFRDRWMARKDGILTQVNDLWLKAAPKESKRDVGQRVNQLKGEVEQKIESALQQSQNAGSQSQTNAERIDITLPALRRPIGAEHPVIKTMNEIVSVFRNLGYSVEEGPVIESDYYNFESLNFPPNHPARDTQDTLFIDNQESKPQRERLLLRTHTSPVQIRTMEKMKPPLRIVLVLHDMEELSSEQVAEVLGLQVGTVRVRLHRARLAVRREMSRLLKGGPGHPVQRASGCPSSPRVMWSPSRPGQDRRPFC